MLVGERVGLEWEDPCSVLALVLSDLGPTCCLPDSSGPAWQGGLYVGRPHVEVVRGSSCQCPRFLRVPESERQACLEA